MGDRPRCEACKFWVGPCPGLADENAADGLNGAFGYCHRLPPQWVGNRAVMPATGADHPTMLALNWVSPVTDAGYWCGEYRPKEARLATRLMARADPAGVTFRLGQPAGDRVEGERPG